jgi:4-carboxymuconolactone decarboxylase
MARVKLIQNKEDVAPEHNAIFDELAALRGRISGPSTVVLHSPGLARPWNEISEYLHGQSVVAAADAELAVCVAAREQDCGYVWNAHTAAARRAGVSDESITVVREGRSTDELPADQAVLVQYVRQLFQNNRVEPEVFDRLLEAHDPKWLVELTVWVARYAALAGILNGFEVMPDNPTDVLPERKTPGATTSPPPQTPSGLPRIPPVTRAEQLAEADRPQFDTISARVGGRRARGILLHSPELAKRVFDVGDWFNADSEISTAHRELAVLAVARERDALDLWAVHLPLARKAGVSEAAITAVRDRSAFNALAPEERDVVDYVRQQLRTHRISQELFDRLQQRHGTRWLVELTCLIGHFGIVSALDNAFEIAPEPGAEALPLG